MPKANHRSIDADWGGHQREDIEQTINAATAHPLLTAIKLNHVYKEYNDRHITTVVHRSYDRRALASDNPNREMDLKARLNRLAEATGVVINCRDDRQQPHDNDDWPWRCKP